VKSRTVRRTPPARRLGTMTGAIGPLPLVARSDALARPEGVLVPKPRRDLTRGFWSCHGLMGRDQVLRGISSEKSRSPSGVDRAYVSRIERAVANRSVDVRNNPIETVSPRERVQAASACRSFSHVKMKAVPRCGGALSTLMVPPWPSTDFLTIARPMPLPSRSSRDLRVWNI
jgi:hypothetical protein